MHQEAEQRELGQAEVVAHVDKAIQEAYTLGYERGYRVGYVRGYRADQQDCEDCGGCNCAEEQCCEPETQGCQDNAEQASNEGKCQRPALDTLDENARIAAETSENLLCLSAAKVVITREGTAFTVTGSYTIC